MKRLGAVLALLLALGIFTADAVEPPNLISAVSEQGSASFHRHLVRPGLVTTFSVFVANPGEAEAEIKLTTLEAPEGWEMRLLPSGFRLAPGERAVATLSLRPRAGLEAGSVASVAITAVSGSSEDRLTVEAEAVLHRKIYFISIDSLDPRYLELNSAGTGPGRDGDWLMPNLHRFMGRAVFYPNNLVHVITATDMNHFNYLAGTMTGTSGISLVGGFIFGFDDKNRPIVKSAANVDQDLARYGADGRHVDTLFNAVKAANPNAWTAFVSGKNWVPELFRRPEFGIDRIIHGMRVPDFLAAPGEAPKPGQSLGRAVRALLPGKLPFYAHELGNPAGLTEPQDPREQYQLARLMSSLPASFPPDAWTADAAIKEIVEEDPDVMYILLAAVDDAGHAYGSAFDLDEWDDRGTPEVIDDISKYDPRASRQGILNVVREADRQTGLILDTLEARGLLDEAAVVIESDHGMITYCREGLDGLDQLKKAYPFKAGRDYFFGGAADVGMVILRKDDPAVLPAVEKTLESWRVKNPVTDVEESPVLVFNREEMKSGRDEATGKQWMLPREYYSEYYCEHRKDGEQVWPDLLVLTAPHYKFKVQNFGLGNLGMANVPIKLPEWGYFLGGHGSFETRTALLLVGMPGWGSGVDEREVYAMDVAPVLFGLNGWAVPGSVDGRGLPGRR